MTRLRPSRLQQSAPVIDDVASMIILCADDYAMTEGVSRAIGELAAARRLSATSVHDDLSPIGRAWRRACSCTAGTCRSACTST